MPSLIPIQSWIEQLGVGVGAGDRCPVCEGDAMLPLGYECPYCDDGLVTAERSVSMPSVAWSLTDEHEGVSAEAASAYLYWRQVRQDLSAYASVMKITPRESAALHGVAGLLDPPPGQEIPRYGSHRFLET